MSTHYSATAKALHWGIALLIFAQLGLGVYMTDLELSPTKLQIYAWHKWTGVTLFLLVVMRVVWRIAHQPPALPEHMARLEQFVAHASHYLLYVLMFAIPLSGWLRRQAPAYRSMSTWRALIPALRTVTMRWGARPG